MKPIAMKRLLAALSMGVTLSAVAPRPEAQAGPVLLLEPASGTVLAAEDPDQAWYPASLTKLMTAYVTFEAVRSGKIAWDGKVPLSENARAQPATRIGLRLGIDLTVEQAIRGLILRSANDFAMGLAELIGGSEEGFAKLQNATAVRLGMTRSHFKNPHGLPDPEQITSARDLAILASALLKDFPDRAEVFSTPIVRIHRQDFHSQNDLLRTLVGADGMKTGFTCGAGYNVVASATREGRRLVAIVLGAVTRQARSQRAAELLEQGFAHIEGKTALTTVALNDLAFKPELPGQVHDMARETRAGQCGNGRRRSPAVAAGKQPVTAKAEGDAAAPPVVTKGAATGSTR